MRPAELQFIGQQAEGLKKVVDQLQLNDLITAYANSDVELVEIDHGNAVKLVQTIETSNGFITREFIYKDGTVTVSVKPKVQLKREALSQRLHVAPDHLTYPFIDGDPNYSLVLKISGGFATLRQWPMLANWNSGQPSACPTLMGTYNIETNLITPRETHGVLTKLPSYQSTYVEFANMETPITSLTVPSLVELMTHAVTQTMGDVQPSAA